MNNTSNKKITFLIESLSDGGAERVTSVLANSFCNSDFDVNIIILNKKSNEYLVKDKIKKHYLSAEKSPIRLFRVIKRIKKINKLIRKIDSDVIISLAMPSTNINLISCLLSHRKKVILSERNDPNFFPKSKGLKKIRNFLYKLTDNVVFQTNDAKKYFTKTIQEKGVIIPNPIKEDLPRPYEGNRKLEIVNFCRLDSQKNLIMLIDAFALLSKEYPDYILSIYGKGPLENELKEYAENSIENGKVNFKGYEKDIHNKILDSAMFVSSSDYEGISNSMLESLALGIPTICTDCPVGGARMFIKPYKNGLLVPVGDTIALYKAMKEVIEDQELSKNISQNAVKIREELSADKIFRKWLNIVES